MTIKVTRKGDSFTVETDSEAKDTLHKMLQGDRQLIGGMKSYGVEKMEFEEPEIGSMSYAAVHDEFDKQYKKKTGNTHGYFGL